MPPGALRQRLTAVALAATGLTLLAGAPAGAAVTTFGSDLSARADFTFKRPGAAADTAFWQTVFPGGRSAAVPEGGQIIAFRLKGRTLRPKDAPEPENLIHLNRLRREADGRIRKHPTGGTSQGFFLPFTGPSQQINEFRPTNFCVEAGDILALSDVGGFEPTFYPEGVEHRVFSRPPGAAMQRYTRHNGINNGDYFTSPESGGVIDVPDVEMLMQLVLATGPDAEPFCPGGSRGVVPPQVRGSGPGGAGGGAAGGAAGAGSGSGSGSGASGQASRTRITSPRVGVTRAGRVRLAVFCPKAVRCRGVVTLSRGGRRVGRASYSVASRRTGRVSVRLSAATRATIRAARTRRVSVRASVVDRPGGAGNTSSRTVVVRGPTRRR